MVLELRYPCTSEDEGTNGLRWSLRFKIFFDPLGLPVRLTRLRANRDRDKTCALWELMLATGLSKRMGREVDRESGVLKNVSRETPVCRRRGGAEAVIRFRNGAPWNFEVFFRGGTADMWAYSRKRAQTYKRGAN
jgi:hypothetical protein